MINIRRGSFETNSSSSHAIVYAPKSYKDLDLVTDDYSYKIEDGVFYIGRYSGLYYGRSPFQVLYSFIDKLRYAYANFGDCKDLLDIVQKYYPDVKRISRFQYKYNENNYNDWVKRGKPADEGYYHNVFVGTDEPYLERWMKKYKFTLEEFLTDPHYVVIVDGDEYCIWDDMNKLGLVTDNIDPDYSFKKNIVKD